MPAGSGEAVAGHRSPAGTAAGNPGLQCTSPVPCAPVGLQGGTSARQRGVGANPRLAGTLLKVSEKYLRARAGC